MQSTNDINTFPAHKQFVLTAGSQGEQLAALTQVANGSHQRVHIDVGDIVIFSARVIPGNEKAVNNVVSKLFRLGVKDVQPRAEQVHVSGHASADELDMVLRLINPFIFIPIHGEYRHLVAHARLARNTGVDKDNAFVIEDGEVLFLTGESGQVVGNIETKLVSVKGNKISNR